MSHHPRPATAARQLRGWRRLGSSGNAPRALRWGTVESAGLLVSAALVGPFMAGYALMGVQTAQAGWLSPLRPRLARLGGAGLAVLVGEALGMLVAGHHVVEPLAMGLFTWIVMWLWHALRLGSPGPVNLVMGAAMGTYLGWDARGIEGLLEMTALGLALVSVMSVLVLLAFDHLPEREAVRQAADAVDELLAHDQPAEPDRDAGDRTREVPEGRQDPTDVAVLRRRAWTKVHTAFGVLLADRRPGHPLHGPVVRELMDQLTGLYQTLIAHLQRDLDLPGATSSPAITPLGTPPVRYLLRTSLSRTSQATLLADRAALAVALAAGTCVAFGVHRPYWAMLSAAIVLHMGTSRHALTVRAAHRVGGTLVGLGLYFVVQGLAAGEWVRMGIVVFSLYATELVITRAYAYGVVFITLYALLTIPVRGETALTTVIADRMVETLIGVACALAVTAVLGRRSERAAVEHQYRTTVATLRAELRQLAEPATGGGAARRRDLVFELARSGALLLELRAEASAEGRPWLAVHRALSELGYDVIAVAHAPGVLSPGTAARTLAELDAVLAEDPAPDLLAARLRVVKQDFLSAARHERRSAEKNPAPRDRGAAR